MIEIRGTNTVNKGAQLMLIAIADRLSTEFRLTAPTVLSEYDVRARLGLWQSLQVNRYPRFSLILGDMVPKLLRNRYGLASRRDISGVVDASGFAYSDSFQVGSLKSEASYSTAWSEWGIPKVMLPQAFGPFNDREKLRYSLAVLKQAKLIFARDDISFQHLEALGLKVRIERAPDFTIALQPPEMPRIVDFPFAAIVPNAKIVAKQVAGRDDYVAKLVEYGTASRERGLDAIVIVHESGDRELGIEIGNRLGARIFSDQDPLVLKAVLGQSELIVSSRFHAIVGGLSQGVPTLALGWSHKYQELLRDFGVENWLVTMAEDPSEAVRTALDDAVGRESLRVAKPVLLEKIDCMWTDTIACLR